MTKTSVADAVAAIGRGEMVIVSDEATVDSDGDLVMAAQFATAERLAFFVRYTSGVICAALTPERLDDLRIPLMVDHNLEASGKAFTDSVDFIHGTATGISAEDRALTVRSLADRTTVHTDFARPGHIFPLRYRIGGVLRRAGRTEAAIDLVRLAGLEPGAVLCEIVNDDGTVAQGDVLLEFAADHELPIVAIADLIAHRRANERLVDQVAAARVPTAHGEFVCHVYEDFDGTAHIALTAGDIGDNGDEVLVRLHSECLTGDLLGSLRCDCGPQLHRALELIAKEGRGVLVYQRGHEGRGIGIASKIRAYHLQDQGADTVDANLALGLPVDGREYGIAAQILVDLGVQTIQLMSNNPEKFLGLDGYGLEVVGRVPMEIEPNPENLAYLRTKRDRLGHLLTGLEGA